MSNNAIKITKSNLYSHFTLNIGKKLFYDYTNLTYILAQAGALAGSKIIKSKIS